MVYQFCKCLFYKKVLFHFIQHQALKCLTSTVKLYHANLKQKIDTLTSIHTLRVHYAHAAANLNSGYSKYAKVARAHYFCTIALRTSRAVLMRA